MNSAYSRLEIIHKHDFRNKNSDFASPPGFNLAAGQSHSEVARDTDQSQLIIKKSWDCALGPVKGVSKISPMWSSWKFTTNLPFLDPDESSHNVHGWKLDLNLPNHDGWNVPYQTS